MPASVAPYLPAPHRSPPHPTSPRKQRQLRRTLSFSAAEGMAAEIVTAFVGGSVLTGWAIYLGCSPFVIAMLGALPFLAQMVQFPSAWITSRFGSRRVAIFGYAVGRLIYAPLIALPFLPIAVELKRLVLLGVAGVAASFIVVGTNAWIAWMGEVVPASVRGRYFGKRLSLVTVSGAAGALTAGLVLDMARRADREGLALAAFAAVACVAGAVTLWFLTRQQDVAEERRQLRTGGFDFSAAMRALRDPVSRPLLRYQIAWNAAIGISASFFAVHMLQNLGMGFALIAAHGVAVAAMRVLVSPLWGRMIDVTGARPVLVVCSFALPVVPLIWLLPTPEALIWPLLLDVVLAGGLWAGHMLAIFELPLAVTPRADRPYYLAAFHTAGGLAFAVAAGIGGLLAQQLPSHVLLFGTWLDDLHVLFLISAAGRLLAAPLALAIAEPGARPVESLLRIALARIQMRGAWLVRAVVPSRR